LLHLMRSNPLTDKQKEFKLVSLELHYIFTTTRYF